MSLELVTGYKGVEHVTAEQVADANRAIYGDAAIADVGNKMAVTIQTANQITVQDGVAFIYGREVIIPYGEYENVAITSGTSGMMRKDIVVMQYSKVEDTGIESVTFQVIEGTPDATAPVDPTYSNTDIRTGVSMSQVPFCRVNVQGTAITSVDKLMTEIPSMKNVLDGKTSIFVEG